MSSTNDIQPPDEPLDPHTLEVAIDKLSERIYSAGNERDAEAAADRPDAADEWDACIKQLLEARSDLIALLADVNPRARVVVLPEPCDEFGGPSWLTDTGNVRVDQRGRIYADGPRVGVSAMRSDQCERLASVLLSASVEAAGFAGGAQ